MAMKNMIDRWTEWLEKDETLNSLEGDRSAATFKYLGRTVRNELGVEGFEMPLHRRLKHALEEGFEPLPAVPSRTKQKGGAEVRVCTFVHFLNMLWQPVLRYLESLLSLGKAPPTEWTAGLQMNYAALGVEMSPLGSFTDVMPEDEWADFISQTLQRIVGVSVTRRHVQVTVSSFSPLLWECTRANAYHLLRSSLCTRLVGPGMAAQVARSLLAEVSEFPVAPMSERTLAQKAKEDLVATLEQLHCPLEDMAVDADEQPLKKMRRDKQSIMETMTTKTEQVLFMVQNRVTNRRTLETVQSAAHLVWKLMDEADRLSPEALKGMLVSRWTALRHLLLLDGALDRVTADEIAQLRDQGRFAGAALATDESPPSQPRFAGLRFQITALYYGAFPPVSEWEESPVAPLLRYVTLGDICNCPGKKGVDVVSVVEKQLGRQGLTCYDVVSCTGDGGGENEGAQGIHAFFEHLNDGYVRRRCLPHIAWRTSGAALKCSSLSCSALAAYLTNGITWARLRAIATQAAPAGLGLFADGGPRCRV